MFPCVLEMMRKVLPGWEGMNFFKDLHSHRSFFFVAGRQEAEKGLCGSVCILFLSFLGNICVRWALSRNFCYFLKIQNHRWQKNALKDNPPSLSPAPPSCVVYNSARRRFFPPFLSTRWQSRWGEVKREQSWDVRFPSPAKRGGVRAHGRGGHGGSPGHGWAGRKVGRRAGTPPSVCGRAFIPSLVWRRCCSLIGASGKYNLPFPVNRIREMQI